MSNQKKNTGFRFHKEGGKRPRSLEYEEIILRCACRIPGDDDAWSKCVTHSNKAFPLLLTLSIKILVCVTNYDSIDRAHHRTHKYIDDSAGRIAQLRCSMQKFPVGRLVDFKDA